MILGGGTALVMVALVALQPNSGSAAAQGSRTPAGTRFSGKAFRFNQVKPGTRADLTRHKGNFPNIQGPGVPLIGVQRIYELLDAGANRR